MAEQLIIREIERQITAQYEEMELVKAYQLRCQLIASTCALLETKAFWMHVFCDGIRPTDTSTNFEDPKTKMFKVYVPIKFTEHVHTLHKNLCKRFACAELDWVPLSRLHIVTGLTPGEGYLYLFLNL